MEEPKNNVDLTKILTEQDVEKMNDSQIDAYLKRHDLMEKIKNRQDAQATVDAFMSKMRSRAQDMNANVAAVRAIQNRCTHKKGGRDREAVLYGQGNDGNYSVIKHQTAGGPAEWIVLCTRCQRLWVRPVRTLFKTQEEYVMALNEYNQALAFPTDNQASSSTLFTGGDFQERYRETLARNEAGNR